MVPNSRMETHLIFILQKIKIVPINQMYFKWWRLFISCKKYQYNKILILVLEDNTFNSYIPKNSSGDFAKLNRAEKKKPKGSGIYPDTVFFYSPEPTKQTTSLNANRHKTFSRKIFPSVKDNPAKSSKNQITKIKKLQIIYRTNKIKIRKNIRTRTTKRNIY